ncbi:MAG: iron complex outermembrane receptor protein, partial [Limisphaerales bacterium]
MTARTSSIFLLLFISSICLTQAQTGTISGSIIDEQGPLPFATAILKSAADSSIVKAEITGESGEFFFQGISYGAYLLESSYVGKTQYDQISFTLGESKKTLSPVLLMSTIGDLAEVKISAIKPLIEVMADKTVLNVENTLASTGTNGLELLRKAPGVILDNNDNVILDGKTGVQIYIDGKPSPLSGEDLNNFLRSMQSTDIEAIEIITQPSAKYDAAGNAGIINFRLKADKNIGTNGTISAGYAYGQNHHYNTSLSLNNRTKKTNLFGSYSNSFGKNYSYIFLDRIQQNVRYDSETESTRDNTAHNMRIGFDFFPDRKHTIGILLNGNRFNTEVNALSNTPITP